MKSVSGFYYINIYDHVQCEWIGNYPFSIKNFRNDEHREPDGSQEDKKLNTRVDTFSLRDSDIDFSTYGTN